MGSGFHAHPAVTDNCMQLGPMLGALQALSADVPRQRDVTRVVAGLAGFFVAGMPGRGCAAAAADMRAGEDGSVDSCHSLLGGSIRSLAIVNLQVPLMMPVHIFSRLRYLIFLHLRFVQSQLKESGYLSLNMM